MEKNVAYIHFQQLSQFCIIFMANYPFENVNMYTFCGEGWSEKVYFLYTHLNVDKYGRSLT